jgi:F420H(2)-dependent biliverdin reductase
VSTVTSAASQPDERLARRLATERNVWLASQRRDGSPHLTPVWFVWDGSAFWICTCTDNVKARNLARDPRLALALEDGDRPVVAEGDAVLHGRPYPPAVVDAFRAKFDWDITVDDSPDGDYGLLLEVEPRRWLLRVP